MNGTGNVSYENDHILDEEDNDAEDIMFVQICRQYLQNRAIGDMHINRGLFSTEDTLSATLWKLMRCSLGTTSILNLSLARDIFRTRSRMRPELFDRIDADIVIHDNTFY